LPKNDVKKPRPMVFTILKIQPENETQVIYLKIWELQIRFLIILCWRIKIESFSLKTLISISITNFWSLKI
jgi:hypothetical protein